MAHPAAVAGSRLSAAPRHRVRVAGPVAQDGVIYGPNPVDVPDAPARLVSVRAGTAATCCSRGPGVPLTLRRVAPCAATGAHDDGLAAGVGRGVQGAVASARPSARGLSKSRITAALSMGLLGRGWGGDLRRSWQGGQAGSGGASSRTGWPQAGEPLLRSRGLPHPAETG